MKKEQNVCMLDVEEEGQRDWNQLMRMEEQLEGGGGQVKEFRVSFLVTWLLKVP